MSFVIEDPKQKMSKVALAIYGKLLIFIRQEWRDEKFQIQSIEPRENDSEHKVQLLECSHGLLVAEIGVNLRPVRVNPPIRVWRSDVKDELFYDASKEEIKTLVRGVKMSLLHYVAVQEAQS